MTTKQKKKFFTIYVERLVMNGYNIEEILFSQVTIKNLDIDFIYNWVKKTEMFAQDMTEEEFEREFFDFNLYYEVYKKKYFRTSKTN